MSEPSSSLPARPSLRGLASFESCRQLTDSVLALFSDEVRVAYSA